MEMVLQNFEEIRKIATRLIECKKKDFRRDLQIKKRQYSPYTLISTIKDELCVNSSVEETEFYSNAALVAKGESPFIYSAFCCMIPILEL